LSIRFNVFDALVLEDHNNARQMRFRNQYVPRTQKQTECDLADVINNHSIYEMKEVPDLKQATHEITVM